MSTCPSCIVYCDFGFCCGGSASDDGLECHAPPQQLPPPPCHGHTEVTTVVNAPMQLPPPPPPPPPPHGHTEVITAVVNAPMQPPPPHPRVLVPYNNQLPPPVPAPPHPPRPPTVMVYDTLPPLQAIVPRRQCAPPPPPPPPPAKAYQAGSSPLPPVSKSTQLAKPDGDVPSSRRYETDDADPSALSMVVPTTTKAPSTPPAASGVAAPALQHPVEPSGRDFELGMEYYSQQHHRRQEYFLMQGRS